MKLTSALDAMKTRDGMRKYKSFGSFWKPGNQATVLYPIYWDDDGKPQLLVSSVFGHQIDMRNFGIKASFIPTHSEINEDGDVVKEDTLLKFSKIVKVYIDGEKQRRIDELQNNPDWDNLPKAAYEQALADIEKDYDPNNLKAIKPAVGRFTMLITTEVIYIPMVNDELVTSQSEAGIATQTLSNSRINKLYSIMRNKRVNLTPNDKYLEVTYNFTGNNKSEAGKAEPKEVMPEYRMSVRYPDAYRELEDLISKLPADSDVIKRHNYSYREVPETDIISAIQVYTLRYSKDLATLPEASQEILEKNAAIIKELRIPLKDTDPTLRARITGRNSELPTPNIPTGIGQAPSISELMGSEFRADDTLAEAVNLDIS
jgi:hypothetical protein